jgi:transcriptional regulator with XRE-family HTH domain
MEKPLGARIRELRQMKDISLREFAKKLGNMSAAHISDIELGRRYPSEDLLGKISVLLNEPIEDLRCYDPRVPVEELKKLAVLEPAFGFALRKLANKKISPDEILRLAENKPPREKDK